MAAGEEQQELFLLNHCYPVCQWYRVQAPALASLQAGCYIVYGGRHRYYTACPSWQSFQELYELCDSRLPRHYYELIPEGRPCRLYFDIECDHWSWLAEGADSALLPAVFRELVSFFKYAWPLVFDGAQYEPRRMVYSSACDDHKFSLHAVGLYRCTSNEHLKLPIQNMAQLLLSLGEEYPLLVFTDDKGQQRTVLDTGVYTKNRVFRLLDSSKYGSSRTLKPLQERQPWLDYAVSYLDGREPDLPLPSLSESRRQLRRTQTVSHVPANRSTVEPGSIEETELNSLLTRLKLLIPHASWYRNADLSTGIVGFFCGRDSSGRNMPCVYGKQHRSNNGFLTYSIHTGAAFVYCHNSQCPRDGVPLPELESVDTELFELEGTHVTLFRLCPVYNPQTQQHEPEEWLRELWTDCDVLMIKSPTGTGKTTFCKWVRGRMRDDACITSIGVRRSFCDNTAPLLLLDNYRAIGRAELCRSQQTVVQLESLMKNDLPEDIRVRDLLILDEETAKLSHYFSDTMMSRQRRVWKREMRIREFSRKVLVLCADLDQRAMCLARRVWPNRNIQVVINDYKPEPEHTFTVFLYQDRGMWQKKMQDSLEQGLNIAFTSSSKKEVRRLYREFRENFTCFFMTSDQPDRVREAACSNSAMFADYQWMGYTSTMTVGVDINLDHFDLQFGYVSNAGSTAREFMQMLARVRQLRKKEIHLYCSQQRTKSLDSIPSQESIRKMILHRIPNSEDGFFQHALQRCQLQLEDCDLLKVKEDFLEQSVFYLWEKLRSRANMPAELKRICSDKGYPTEFVACDQNSERVSLTEILSQEIETVEEHSQSVAESEFRFNQIGELAAAETVQDVWAAEKYDVCHRLQLPATTIQAEHVECFGWDHMQQESIANVNLMFQLSLTEEVYAEALEAAIRGAQGSESFGWENPEVLRSRKAELLFTLLNYLLRMPNFLLNDGSYECDSQFLAANLSSIPMDLRKLLREEFHVLFQLGSPLCVTQSGLCLRTLNQCLEQFTNICIKRKRARRDARLTYVFSLETTVRDRWLELFERNPSLAKFSLQEALGKAMPVRRWNNEVGFVPEAELEAEWPDPFISRYKRRRLERVFRLSAP